MPERRSSRATRPHGHSQFVGFGQRYRSAGTSIGCHAVMAVAVVTDTTHYLPRESVERLDLHQVPLYVNWQGRTDKESDLPDFGDVLRLPAQLAGAADHLAAVGRGLPRGLRAAARRGRDIVSIHLSGGISGTVRSAEQARDQLVEGGVDPRADRRLRLPRRPAAWASR